MERYFEKNFMLKPALDEYFDETGKDESSFDAMEFIKDYVPDTHVFKKNPLIFKKVMKEKFPNIKVTLPKTGSGTMPGDDKDSKDSKSEDLYKPDPNFKLSADAQKFLDTYKTVTSDKLLSAAESCQEKYDKIFDTAVGIITGEAFLPHAFICGDAGVGKCLTGDTEVNILVPDSIHAEIEEFLKA